MREYLCATGLIIDRADSPRLDAQRQRLSLRMLFFSALFVAVLLFLAALFHPSSPYSNYGSSLLSASTDIYYSGADLAAGVYDPDHAAVAPNPLPTDAVFADIPFAKVGESKDKSGKVPNWAGGDWGDAEAEKDLVGGEGKRWNGTHWFDPTVILISLDGVRYVCAFAHQKYCAISARMCSLCFTKFGSDRADNCGFLLFQDGLSRGRLDAAPARHLQERHRQCLRWFRTRSRAS